MRAFVPTLFVSAALLAGCGPTPSTKPNPSSQPKPSASSESKPSAPQAATGGCHPGCFPVGTLVSTPTGLRPVQTLREGEPVILIDADGRAKSGPVLNVFDTCNELVEVRTDGGTLTTTVKQPLCLQSGDCKPAGELSVGDVIWQWVNGERHAVVVSEVVPTGRHEPVYNLVVGEGNVFVAGGFLARGKPPVTP